MMVNNYNFDPALTARIKKYSKQKIYPGGRAGIGIRWLLEDETGTSIHCDKCGNIANVCLFEVHGRHLLKVPICKRHAEELIAESEDYAVQDLTMYKRSEYDLIKVLLKNE